MIILIGNEGSEVLDCVERGLAQEKRNTQKFVPDHVSLDSAISRAQGVVVDAGLEMTELAHVQSLLQGPAKTIPTVVFGCRCDGSHEGICSTICTLPNVSCEAEENCKSIGKLLELLNTIDTTGSA